MRQGDFTGLAQNYANRPGYSKTVLRVIADMLRQKLNRTPAIAEVGAGTGKLTLELLELGYQVDAVEPNDDMRSEGEKATRGLPASWRKGSGEETDLPTGTYSWLLMASSFHWVDATRALPEFKRVLHAGGCFTALWNPRDIERSELQQKVEAIIKQIVPELKRVSSGGAEFTKTMFERIVAGGHFSEPFFLEAEHEVRMTPERYLGAWRSVNDIQAQAGPERFQRIMDAIAAETEGMEEIVVPYRTRAWSAFRS